MVEDVGVDEGVGVVVADRGRGGESGGPLEDVAGVRWDESSEVMASWSSMSQ